VGVLQRARVVRTKRQSNALAVDADSGNGSGFKVQVLCGNASGSRGISEAGAKPFRTGTPSLALWTASSLVLAPGKNLNAPSVRKGREQMLSSLSC